VTAVSFSGLRRTLYLGVMGTIFFVLAGTTYQGVATALERRQLPHPGRLIDVGGHQLHLDCSGEGHPIVVLEAPSMGMSAVWGWIRQDLTSRTRVCGYDRSGLGWSESGDFDYDPSRAIDELHVLLERASETGPYVLVGHEFGAALATAYAARYRPDLAALVLIDPPAQDNGPDQSSMMRFADSWPWLARVGVLRGTRLLSRRADGLPETSTAAVSAFLNRPDHLTRSAGELSRWNETVRLGSAVPLDTSLRVLRLEAGGTARSAGLNDSAQARVVSTAIANLVDVVRTSP
jgi:pimeloyl-ACP methyl ester carboxylesterase